MRYEFSLIAALFLCATISSAQVAGEQSLMATTPSVPALTQISLGVPALVESLNPTPAAVTPVLLPALSAMPAVAVPPPPPVEYYPSYAFQGFIGFDFFRFYQIPGTRINLPGVYGSMAYFLTKNLGVEGVLAGGFGHQFGERAKMSFTGGGARYRYPVGYRIEPFVHADFGFAHYVPQTANGGQGAIGILVGGGIDYRLKRWISVRAEGNAEFTRFFSASQINPVIAGGVVFNY
jgi:hypothetical protein